MTCICSLCTLLNSVQKIPHNGRLFRMHTLAHTHEMNTSTEIFIIYQLSGNLSSFYHLLSFLFLVILSVGLFFSLLQVLLITRNASVTSKCCSTEIHKESGFVQILFLHIRANLDQAGRRFRRKEVYLYS